MDPFTGTWVANLAKSHRHKNHQFQSAILRFEVSGNAVSLTQAGVNMSGKDESSTLTLDADGEAHAVLPQVGHCGDLEMDRDSCTRNHRKKRRRSRRPGHV